jgi:DNA-binding XRE family transcriptional regulator
VAKNEPKKSRTQAAQTQREAAAMVGVHWRTWQNWETGVHEIPEPMLKLYRHLTGIERMPFRAVGYDRPEGA